MGNPLTYDIVVASAVFLSVIIGAFAGFRRLFLIFLVSLAVPLLMRLVPWLMKFLPGEMTSVHAGFVIMALSLALVLVIIAVVPRARTAAGRLSGAVFAVACAMLILAFVSLNAELTTSMQEARKSSVTGRVVFALGDALLSMPATPNSLMKKPEQPK